ncbi:MAG TPA: SGNH/GDSL hydrolase family protein [Pyrinomonadaceae bacterium]|nr:SGNH/GDSL hydrolase family protein [Pyrinomonadaceae bacterium]
MRNFAKKLLLVFFSTFITLAIIEVGLRLTGHKYTGSTYIADPLLGWGLRPGAGAWETEEGVAWSKINSHGYRDRERSVNKPPGVYRVAILGDSFTEARQVDMDKTFTALAEQELNRRHCLGTGQVEVLNFGVPGYGTGQEFLQLRERVWQFNPDMIVLQFYSGNDMFNNHRALNSTPELAPYFLLKDGKLELDNSFHQGRKYNPFYIKLKAIGADITNRLVLLQVVYKWMSVRAQQREEARQNAEPEKTSTTDPNAPPPGYQRFLCFLPPTLPSMIEAWQVTEALIGQFSNEVRSHHVPMLMLIVPTVHQIKPDPKAQEAYRAEYHIDSLEYADDRIEQDARSNGMTVVRPTKQLLEEARRTGTFMAGFPNSGPNGGHFNERGHAVVARELVQGICDTAMKYQQQQTQASGQGK